MQELQQIVLSLHVTVFSANTGYIIMGRDLVQYRLPIQEDMEQRDQYIVLEFDLNILGLWPKLIVDKMLMR